MAELAAAMNTSSSTAAATRAPSVGGPREKGANDRGASSDAIRSWCVAGTRPMQRSFPTPSGAPTRSHTTSASSRVKACKQNVDMHGAHQKLHGCAGRGTGGAPAMCRPVTRSTMPPMIHDHDTKWYPASRAPAHRGTCSSTLAIPASHARRHPSTAEARCAMTTLAVRSVSPPRCAIASPTVSSALSSSSSSSPGRGV